MSDDLLGAQPRCLAAQAFDVRRRPFVGVDRFREILLDAGTQNLDGNVAAVRGCRVVDLRNGGSPNGLFIKARKEALEWRVERHLDGLLDLRERSWRQVILQLREVGRGLLADEVRARRQGLAELHRSRADRDQSGGVIGRARNASAETSDAGEAPHCGRGERVFLDAVQGAVASQRPAPLQQTPQVGGCGRQIFQPEWIETRPPSIGSAFARMKPASAIMALNMAGLGNRRMLSTR